MLKTLPPKPGNKGDCMVVFDIDGIPRPDLAFSMPSPCTDMAHVNHAIFLWGMLFRLGTPEMHIPAARDRAN